LLSVGYDHNIVLNSWRQKGAAPGRFQRLGSGRSFRLYSVARGRLINMVAFVPTDTDAEESWSAPSDLKALAAEYAGWDKLVQDAINSLEETFRWASMIVLRCLTGPPGVSPSWGMQHTRWFLTSAKVLFSRSKTAFPLAVLLEGCTANRLDLYQELKVKRASKVQALARAAGKLYRSEHDNPAEKAHRGVEVPPFDRGRIKTSATAQNDMGKLHHICADQYGSPTHLIAYVPFLCDRTSAFRRRSPQPDANTLRQSSGPRMTVRL
jgi:hypothetical protein